jgi:hypothetical protein
MPARPSAASSSIWPTFAAAAVAALAGCDGSRGTPADAPPKEPDAPPTPDAGPDAATCPQDLLVGGAGMTVESQGWAVIKQAPATLTYGPDYVRLETSTTSGATTSGQLLLHRQGVLPPPPFDFEVELLVETVNPHNPLDAAAAILGSFSPPFGENTDRSQMIYLDPNAIGWADDFRTAVAAITDGAFHKVRLSVASGGVARVTFDERSVLARNGFASNGAIAIGDQTNEPSVDGAIQIRRVTLYCP